MLYHTVGCCIYPPYSRVSHESMVQRVTNGCLVSGRYLPTVPSSWQHAIIRSLILEGIMTKKSGFQRSIIASVLATAMTAVPGIAYTCTSLLYTDANGAPYAGRTMELPMELPYQATYYPREAAFGSKADNHHVLSFQAKYAFISLTVPDPVTKNLKVVEGLNDQGLSFSVLAFASTEGPKDMTSRTIDVLAAIDLGSWALSQFKDIGEVKAALQKQPVLVTALLPLGILKTPFHYTLHDASGASVVIEFANGKQEVIDNPLGVMTNGPEFSWHMTNLNNYTFLSNKDQSELEINGQHFKQPDSGIATVALPASNTSVGRFVRAVYYSQFAAKSQDIQTGCHDAGARHE